MRLPPPKPRCRASALIRQSKIYQYRRVGIGLHAHYRNDGRHGMILVEEGRPERGAVCAVDFRLAGESGCRCWTKCRLPRGTLILPRCRWCGHISFTICPNRIRWLHAGARQASTGADHDVVGRLPAAVRAIRGFQCGLLLCPFVCRIRTANSPAGWRRRIRLKWRRKCWLFVADRENRRQGCLVGACWVRTARRRNAKPDL